MNNNVFPVRGLGTVNFLEALAAGAASAVNALHAPPIGSRRFLIRAVSVVSVQNLGMIFQFYAAVAGVTANVDTNRFVSSFGFVAGQGVRYNSTGLYLYYVDGLSIPYYMDGSGNAVNPPTLNVVLQIQGATAKLANADGAIHPVFWLEPVGLIQ